MAKLTIKERLENPQLREGFLDSLLKKIADKKIKATKKDMITILKGIYGSEDKISDARKKFLGL